MKPTLYLFLLLLSGCAIVSPPPPPQDAAIAWPVRLAALRRLEQWSLSGVAGIRTPTQSFTANLHWHQANDAYSLLLFGPLGTHRIQLEGDPHTVTLMTPEQPLTTSTDAERLLQQQLGWRLPVQSLHYWIRGIPAPGRQAKLTWDSRHRLKTLEQQGWRVEYIAFNEFHGLDLPSRLEVKTTGLDLRLVIHEWRL